MRMDNRKKNLAQELKEENLHTVIEIDDLVASPTSLFSSYKENKSFDSANS